MLFPTRARETNSPPTLDLVISNGEFVENVLNLSPLGKSDHSVLHCMCKFYAVFKPCSRKYFFDKGDYMGFRKCITDNFNIASNQTDTNINIQWESLKNILHFAAEKCIPSNEGLVNKDPGKSKYLGKNTLPKEVRVLIKRNIVYGLDF